MNQHNHAHGHGHHHPNQKNSPHKDWRLWVVVGLMLAALFAYVLSDDEAIQPAPEGAIDAPTVPAAE